MKAITEDCVPRTTDAERAMLGGILVSGNGALEICLRILEPEDLLPPHRTIFAAMIALRDRGEPPDPVLLKDQLSRRGELEIVGGPAYLASLTDAVPHSANVEWYARQVKAAADRRVRIERAYEEIESAGESEPQKATDERLTDVGNARRLVRLHSADLQYVHAWSRWLVWDGARWAADERGHVCQMAKSTVAAMYAEAASERDDGRRTELAAHARKSDSESRINAMVVLARSEPPIPITPQELDTDPWLLNVANGTLDLKTCALRPHRRRDLITKAAGTGYQPEAQCPTWDAFLHRIMDGNADLIAFLRRVVGYSLTGETSEHVLFMLWGTGANGKSTFVNVLLDLLGDYGHTAPADLFTVRRADNHPAAIADLQGARLVASVETEDGHRLAGALVKSLTGGDPVRARHLYADYFTYRPSFKLFLATNHKPRIPDSSHAMWRRIRLIPFAVTIAPEVQDRRLIHRLRAELPGILGWAVQGCLEWQTQGLGTAPDVEAATEAYRTEQDTLGAFLEERSATGPEKWVYKDDLYKAYTDWSGKAGERPMTKKRLGQALLERGIKEGRSKSERWWDGIGLDRTEEVTGDTR